MQGFPCRLVGSDPDRPGGEPADSWDHLKSLLRSHRCFIHTSSQQADEGYDLALLEAMAIGMPVVSTVSPNSPVRDGVSGFVSDDIAYLRDGVRRLLADRELAVQMGQEARHRVLQEFTLKRFILSWQAALEAASEGWSRVAGAS